MLDILIVDLDASNTHSSYSHAFRLKKAISDMSPVMSPHAQEDVPALFDAESFPFPGQESSDAYSRGDYWMTGLIAEKITQIIEDQQQHAQDVRGSAASTAPPGPAATQASKHAVPQDTTQEDIDAANTLLMLHNDDGAITAPRDRTLRHISPPGPHRMMTQDDIDAANVLASIRDGAWQARLVSRLKPTFNAHVYPPPDTSDWPTDLTYPLMMGDLKIDRVPTFVNVSPDSKSRDAWREELGWNQAIHP